MNKFKTYFIVITLAGAALAVSGATENFRDVRVGDQVCEQLATAVDFGEHGNVYYCAQWLGTPEG
ncbi:MAG: hypothetical protein ACPGPG_08575 [Luminiphilus sp.]